jgi:4-hydroxy-2-oxoheptanedioate aldolase
MAKASGPSRPSSHDSTALGRQFRKRVENGELILGGMIMEMIQPSIVKIYKYAGFDFIYMDNEHVHMAGLPSMAAFVQAARDNGLPVIAKCPELGRAEVGRLLEAGVSGIQMPRTESRRDLETLIDFMRFPPVGSRAGAPIYGNVDYLWPDDLAGWMKKSDEATLVVGHIETRRGFENFDEIVSTPGLDIIYVGPLDFSISMGHPGDYDHPQVAKAMDQILEQCKKHDVMFGTTASGAEAAGNWIRKGARFFEVVDELTLIHRGSVEAVDEHRKAMK